MEQVRAFIAIDLSDALKEQIAREQHQWSQDIKGFKWVKPENYHLTLKFLGNVNREKINDVCEQLDHVAQDISPFEVSFEQFGAFPYQSSPRVIWIAVGDGKDELLQTWRKIDRSLVRTGFPQDDRDYQPHLTVGRMKSNRGRGELTSLFKRFGERHWGSMKVRKMCLMESELRKSGPRYSVLDEFAFTRTEPSI